MLVFDSCRSRCPSDLSKSAQLRLPKNVEISSDYKFRTKTAEYRALEKNGRRERISRPGAAAARGIRERARAAGGLACLLREIGWDVAVFEKSAGDLSGRGAGLGLS